MKNQVLKNKVMKTKMYEKLKKIKNICRYYGYDLEVIPNMLECVTSILLEVRQEIIKSEVKQ